MSYDKITVVINTFNSEDIIYHCLDSINQETKILVIENSNKASLKKDLEKKYINVQCFLTGQNLGYAKGNNFGLSKVKSKFALILNPDAILKNDTLNQFLITANNFPDFAIIGPAKQDEFSEIDLHKNKSQVFEVNTLKGFAMFLNMDQFEKIGFFDENFFIYLEEIDLCKRLKKNNKKIYLDKKVIISHKGGSSHNEEMNFEMELSRNWHWMWSTFYYNKKYKGFVNSFIMVFPKLISSIFKYFFFLMIMDKEKKEIYYQRFSGLANSIAGKKSWYRPKV